MSPLFQDSRSSGQVFHVTMTADFNFVPAGVLASSPAESIDFVLDPSQVSSGTIPQVVPTSVPDKPGAGAAVLNNPDAIVSNLPDSPHSWRMDALLTVSSVDALDQATLFAERIVPPHTPTPGQLLIDFSGATFTLVSGANLSWSPGTFSILTVASKVYVAQLQLSGRFQ